MLKNKLILQEARQLRDWLVAIRRKIHQHPETAFQEKNTSELICSELSRMNIPFIRGIGSTGVMAHIGDPSMPHLPVVALRADIDALPVQEETGLSFSSKIPGVMHACGHDGHTAMLLGAARILSGMDIAETGCVRLLFQPAEEGKGGARSMIKDGCLKNVGLIFGGHIDTHFPVGQIAVQEGLICAYADGFHMEILGKGGHAARPHEACDALVAACHFVTGVQSLLTRKINPLQPSVISIGQMLAGTTHNAIAEKAVLKGTVRTTDRETRSRVFLELEQLRKGIETIFGVQCNLKFNNAYPPVINTPEATQVARLAAKAVTGPEAVIPYPVPSLGGEDFSFYLEHVPGCFVRFGAAKDQAENPPAHSSRFDFNEGVLVTGTSFFTACALNALEYLQKKHGNAYNNGNGSNARG